MHKYFFCRKTIGLFLILFNLFILSGCSISELPGYVSRFEEKYEAVSNTLTKAEDDEPDEYLTENEEVIEEDEDIDVVLAVDAINSIAGADDLDDGTSSLPSSKLKVYSMEELLEAESKQSGLIAYESLNEEDKMIYSQMYLALDSMTPGIRLECYDSDKMNKIFNCVMMDHPEIFWVEGYTYTKYTRGDELYAIGYKGIYTIDELEKARRQAGIDSSVNECLASMPYGDDYTKIKYVYEYIIKNTEYDLESPDNQNICSVFLNGKSVCQGYAKAAQYLLREVGIPSALVAGTTSNGQSHAWNIVLSDGAYYYMDVTWGDASYQLEEGMEGRIPEINYDYLCVPSYELAITHTPDCVIDLPACISIADNYYVRENAYFTAVDENKLKALFDKSEAEGLEMAIVKCSDYQTYKKMKDHLITSQNIFKYYNSPNGTASFIENEDKYTISFWL